MDVDTAASILAAAGLPFTVYLAYKQLIVAALGSDHSGIKILVKKSWAPGDNEEEITATVTFRGSRAVYDIVVYLQQGESFYPLSEVIPRMSNSDRSFPLPLSPAELEQSCIFVTWADRIPYKPGLLTYAARFSLSKGELVTWRYARTLAIRNRWNHFVTRKKLDSKLVVPVGKWVKKKRPSVKTQRSFPGWPTVE